MRSLGCESPINTVERTPLRYVDESVLVTVDREFFPATTRPLQSTPEKVRPTSSAITNLRRRIGCRRNWFYLASEHIWTRLFTKNAKRILFSGKPDWMNGIRNGFEGLAHHIENGPITESSFRQYDVVVPLTLSALEEARRYRPLGSSSLPLPTAESVRLCEDKYELNRALIKAGFGQYIPAMTLGPGLAPPYILKKRTGSWGKECDIIHSYEEEATRHDRLMSPDYFCQEFLPGPTEFATHILFGKGKVVKALDIKYLFDTDMPIKGRNKAILLVVHHCSHLDLFSQMLRAIGFEGLCCINYKIVKGRSFLFEINPRFGGSLAPYFFSFVRHLR